MSMDAKNPQNGEIVTRQFIGDWKKDLLTEAGNELISVRKQDEIQAEIIPEEQEQEPVVHVPEQSGEQLALFEEPKIYQVVTYDRDSGADDKEDLPVTPEVNLTDEEMHISHNLPTTYNETSIHAVIHDPAWVFVFWDISASDIENIRSNQNFKSLLIHVAFYDSETDEKPADTIDTKISLEDRMQYVLLSSSKKHRFVQIGRAHV